MKIATLAFSMILISACSSSPVKTDVEEAPRWVNHPEMDFPATRYLASVGTGKSREDAIRDARRQMAESMVSKIRSRTEVRSGSKLNQNTEGKVSGDSTQEMDQKLNLDTSATLRGAEVKEVQEGRSGFFALVVLDKLQARSSLLMEAQKLKTKIASELDSLEEGGFGLKELKSARMDFDSLDLLASEAGSLGLSALVDRSELDSRHAAVEASLMKKVGSRTFFISTVEGDARFQRGLEACLTDAGVKITGTSGSGGSILLTVHEFSQHLSVQGWTKVRFELSALISDPSGAGSRVSESALETGRSRDAVLEMVFPGMIEKLCESVWGRIAGMN